MIYFLKFLKIKVVVKNKIPPQIESISMVSIVQSLKIAKLVVS